MGATAARRVEAGCGHNTRALTGREWGGKEGECPALPAGHQLDGFDCVLIVVAAQPVGGVIFLGEILEDLHEGAWEDASCSLGRAL